MTRRKRIILILVAVVVTFVALVTLRVIIINNWRPASTVDVSPLERLTEEEIGRIGDIWELLEQREGSSDVLQNGSLHVRANIFYDEAEAPDLIQRSLIEELRGYPHGRLNYRLARIIVNNNNTEALLHHTYFDRINIGWDNPLRGSNRHIVSLVRIGNANMYLLETRPWYNFWGDYSSQFIELIVEMLQEVEQP